MSHRALLWCAAFASVVLLRCTTTGEVLSTIASESGGNGGAPASGGAGGMGGDGSDALFEGRVDALSAGDAHTCFLSSGRLFCFGNGEDGALGTGSAEDRLRPTPIGETDDYVAVSAGARTTCAIRAGGELSCTGAGSSGQLGRGSFEGSAVFEPVPLPGPARLVDVGYDHVCAILDSGELYCWGSNAEGQLGQPDPFPDPGVPRATPTLVAAGVPHFAVAAGQGHTCALRADRSLYCWGRNTANQLGLGEAHPDQERDPTRVGDALDYEELRVGQDHGCARRTGGVLECWGPGSSGQLGLGDREGRDRPTLVAEGVTAFSLDTFHTCVSMGGELRCAGRGAEGALGSGTDDQLLLMSVPLAMPRLLAAGRFHSCVAFEVGLACTGANEDGRLGVGDREPRTSFTAVRAP